MISVYNMSCIQGAKEKISDDSVDLMICDPPYNLGYGGTTSKITKKARFGLFANDKLDDRDYRRFSFEWLHEAYRILKPGSHIYVFIDWRMYPLLNIWMKQVGFQIKNVIVWDKTYCSMGNFYRYQYELIIFAWKGKKAKRLVMKKRNVSDVWPIKKVPPQRMKHPTQKPEELMEKIIYHSSQEGDLLVDFFAGSGVVGRVAKKMERNYIGFEIDMKYFNETNNALKNN
ncbi:site-specific DNA-methyltransferase [Tepidibacillus marianensis]|uniref:DNA-methyltransferase n=1 Tax=Tepidibacillus marianensis TaxID=3131995 RepID=UPI0030D0F72F